ncbi:glycosyltransferase [Planktomarina temperata]|nr:glycosyltransferase [Planktomarina temperata]
MMDRSKGDLWLVANSDGALYKFRNSLIKKLSDNFNLISYSQKSVEGSYKKKLEDIGCSQTDLNFSMNLKCVPTIFQLIYRSYFRAPSVVLVYTLPAIFIFSIVATLSKRNFQLIGTVTGFGRQFSQTSDLNDIKVRLLSKLMKFSFARYDHIIFQNNEDRTFCLEHDLITDAKSSIVAGSGVELEKFTPTRDLVCDMPYRYLFMGRGMKQKGLLEFYKVAKLLEDPALRCFYHAGSLDKSLYHQIGDIKEYADKHKVNYLGYIHDVASLLQSVDAVIAPSIYREGIPRSLIEGLAADKYIITCNTIGNKETIINNYNGKFVAHGDIEDLVLAILDYESKGRQHFKGRSRKIAEEKFDVNLIDSHILGIINGEN